MKTNTWMAAFALVSLFVAAPALARDGGAARERVGRTSEPTVAAPAAKEATTRIEPVHRACCVVSHGKVVDHLRG